MTIRNISRDKYYATPVPRSAKYVLEASIGNLPAGGSTLETVLEWRMLSEAELAASESLDGTLMSQGTTEWIIKKDPYPLVFTRSNLRPQSQSVILVLHVYFMLLITVSLRVFQVHYEPLLTVGTVFDGDPRKMLRWMAH